MKRYTFCLLGLVIATTTAAIFGVSLMDAGNTPTYDFSRSTVPQSAVDRTTASGELPYSESRVSSQAQSVTIVDAAERSAKGDPTHLEVESLLASGDAGNELLALDLLYDFEDEEIVPFLHRAMKSDTEQVRAAAVELAVGLEDEEQRAEILELAVSDDAPFVGHAVLDQVEKQPKKIREQVFRSALKLAPAEIGGAVVAELEVDSDHAAVDIMIEGLNSTVDETRSEASLALEFIFEKQFASGSEAQAWWQMNRDKYDRDLVEKF